MERFEIEPVLCSAVPDVADFLYRWRGNNTEDSLSRRYARESVLNIQRRLTWLLLENPVAAEGSRFGYCLRDRLGVIRGLNLAFPAAFLSAGQRILGLCSGSFFVEPRARSLGLYLFKKYLSSPDYSFFFATTCNTASGCLWQTLGGFAVPNSEVEYVLPLKLDVIIPALVATKTSNGVASGIARIGGRCANPIFEFLRPRSARLTLERCEDWAKLSELSLRHQPASHIATDRSAAFLEWRYGQASPLYPCSVYLFSDSRGNEGWFSIGNVIRGKQDQIRGATLLDTVWPREKMSFQSIFQEAFCLAAAAGSDAMFLRSHPELEHRELRPWVIPRKLPAPRAFVMPRRGAPLLALDSLDYDDNDDIAWSLQWTVTRGRSGLSQSPLGAALIRPAQGPQGLPSDEG